MRKSAYDLLMDFLPYIFIFLLCLFLFSKNNRTNERIAELRGEISSLKTQNDSLSKERKDIMAKLAENKKLIEDLNASHQSLLHDKNILENKLNSLKSKYEKANSHANNYTSDSIRRYFSNF